MGKRRDPQEQRRQRERRGERAFLFAEDLSRCLGVVEREDWELAVSMHGGDVSRAARACGVNGVGAEGKALWGRSAEEAASTYRAWRKRQGPRGGGTHRSR